MVDAQQGAQAVPEFKIRVKASEPLGERVYFFLRVKYESFLFPVARHWTRRNEAYQESQLFYSGFPRLIRVYFRRLPSRNPSAFPNLK